MILTINNINNNDNKKTIVSHVVSHADKQKYKQNFTPKQKQQIQSQNTIYIKEKFIEMNIQLNAWQIFINDKFF